MNDRAAWLERRRRGIGGSDVAGVIGISPWQSPWSIWVDKVGLVPVDESTATDAMEFGTRAEPMMSRWFQDRTGLNVGGEQTEVEHPEHPWMLVTVDGFVYDRDVYTAERGDLPDRLGVHEIKCTTDSAAEWAEDIPVHYQCQAQWAMAVTGLPKVWFSVLHLAFGRIKYEVYEFDRDETEIEFLRSSCSTFWHDHVVTGTPPPADAHSATTEALNMAWPDAAGQIDADDKARKLIAAIHEADRWKTQCQADADQLRNRLRALLGDNTDLVDDTGPKPRNLATFRWQERKTVDVNRLLAEHPDIDRTDYERNTDVRVLRVNKPKEAR